MRNKQWTIPLTSGDHLLVLPECNSYVVLWPCQYSVASQAEGLCRYSLFLSTYMNKVPIIITGKKHQILSLSNSIKCRQCSVTSQNVQPRKKSLLPWMGFELLSRTLAWNQTGRSCTQQYMQEQHIFRAELCSFDIIVQANLLYPTCCATLSLQSEFLFYSNLAVFVFKLLAYFHTGSAAMLSEAVHSLVDALNQVTCTCMASQ